MNATSASSYGVDTNWYVDIGATDHIMGELDKLTLRDRYIGDEQVHTTSGQGMEMHIDHMYFHMEIHIDRPIHLGNILHVPKASKSHVSASKRTDDNHAYLEIRPNFLLC